MPGNAEAALHLPQAAAALKQFGRGHAADVRGAAAQSVPAGRGGDPIPVDVIDHGRMTLLDSRRLEASGVFSLHMPARAPRLGFAFCPVSPYSPALWKSSQFAIEDCGNCLRCFIRDEVIAELRLSVSQAARVLGVRRSTLSDLLNGKSSLSPEMALRLEKGFGVSMDLLLKIQAWHDVVRMRAKADEIAVDRYAPA